MRLTATTLAVIVTILFNAGNIEAADCTPNEFVEGGCEVNPHLCQIKCPLAGDTCTPTGASPDLCSPGGEVNSTQSDMDETKCKELCEASRNGGAQDNPDICRYWRFETVTTSDARLAKVKTCTFLRSTECTSHEECIGDCKCGDVGCPGANEGETQPPEISCQGGIDYNSGAEWIHWTCLNDAEPDLPSPYHPDSVLPPKTMCFTTHKCADWDSEPQRKLAVTCDGMTGKWAKTAVGDDTNGHYEGDDGVLGDQPAALSEHKCKAEPKVILSVDIANMGEGAQLSCETPAREVGETFEIDPPNKCVLLCDYHLVMVIKGRLNDEGVFKFYDTTNNDLEVEISDASVIKCWL